LKFSIIVVHFAARVGDSIFSRIADSIDRNIIVSGELHIFCSLPSALNSPNVALSLQKAATIALIPAADSGRAFGTTVKEGARGKRAVSIRPDAALKRESSHVHLLQVPGIPRPTLGNLAATFLYFLRKLNMLRGGEHAGKISASTRRAG
jgi:hypothetical protein